MEPDRQGVPQQNRQGTRLRRHLFALAVTIVICTGMTNAAADQTSTFTGAKDYAKGKLQGQFDAINQGTAQGVIPSYGAPTYDNNLFLNGQGDPTPYGMAKVEICGATASSAYNQQNSMARQECEAVNFLARNRNTYSLDRNDPMFSKAKQIRENAENMFQSLGVGTMGSSTTCTSRVEQSPDIYTTETCTNLAEYEEQQCTMGRVLNTEERDNYRCNEIKGTIFESTCQNTQTVQCQDKRYNLYNTQGVVTGWWQPDGTVNWKSSFGRWNKNAPTPPKYWGKIIWNNAPWYFDQYFNIFYDNGATAYKVATWRNGYMLKDFSGTVRGAWFNDGSFYWDGVRGSWRQASSTQPTYKGAATWTNGQNYDVTWQNYCAGCGGVTLNINGSTWSYGQTYSGQYQASTIKGKGLYNGTWYDIRNDNYVIGLGIYVTISGSTWRYSTLSGQYQASTVKGQALYNGTWYDVRTDNYVTGVGVYVTISGSTWSYNDTQSGSFTNYPQVPPEFPYEISWGGAIWYADASGYIYDAMKVRVAHATAEENVLLDLAGVPHGYFTATTGTGGVVVWDNISGTWQMETPKPPAFWGSFIAGGEHVNFQQPNSSGMLFNSFGDAQVGSFERLPTCTTQNTDGTCATWLREGTCTASPGNCSAPSSMCQSLAPVCADSTPCKTINGITACLRTASNIPSNATRLDIDCWQLTQKYECLQPESNKTCNAFTQNAECTITSQQCIQNDNLFYTGCLNTAYYTSCRTPLPVIPSNAVWLGKTVSLVSSDYSQESCRPLTNNPSCTLTGSACTSTTPLSPLPSGITSEQAAPDGCYQRQDTYACMTGRIDTSECDAYASNSSCTQQSSTCDPENQIAGVCTMEDRTYRCLSQPGQSQTVLDCQGQLFCMNGGCFDTGYENDTDFGRAMGLMEAAREAGVYGTEFEIFKGVSSKCKIKLFGLKNCCKKSGGGGGMSNSSMALKAGMQAGKLFGSPYMYDAMFASDIPWFVERAVDAWSATAWTSTTSFYGLQFSFSATAGLQFVTFDPWSFAFQIGTMILQELLSCDQSEQILAMKRGQNLCHEIGSYCSKKLPLAGCVERSKSYCCYNSRLARIINVQGKLQIGKGWGSAKNPNCSGFTPDEFAAIDFSRIDLSEFIAEIMANIKMPNIGTTSQQIQGTVQQKLQNYYQR